MRRWLAVLALACCLLIAGCSSLGLDQPDTSAGNDQAKSGPPYPDPWPGSPTVVAINASATNRSMIAPVENALEYWEANDDRYGRYTTTFELRPDAEDPDVVIELVDDIGECGRTSNPDAVGCAPLLTNQSLADRPTRVLIETGYTNASTELIVEHELGHVFGLKHGDEPTELMSAWTDRLNQLPQPNVSERRLTWATETLTVYVDRDALPGTDEEIDRQIGAVLDYYNGGAEGRVPPELTLSLTDDRESADIVVRGRQMEQASDESLKGANVDADPALEYITDQTIYVSPDVDPENLGWHVGFWLGDSLIQPESPAGLPPPFDEPETDDRTLSDLFDDEA